WSVAVPDLAALSTSVAAAASSAPRSVIIASVARRACSGASLCTRPACPTRLVVSLGAHQPAALEAVDQVVDARRMHLKARTDLAERQCPAPAHAEDDERLGARARQGVWLEQSVQARHQDLLYAHERGHRAHRRRGR